MYSKRSVFCGSLVGRALGVVLVMASLLGIPADQDLASAQEQAGPATPSPVGDNIVYLPIVLRNYSEPRTTVFGVQIYEPLNSPKAGLSLAKQTGASWVRWPVAWKRIEPSNTTPDKYLWTATDAALLAADRAGMKVILTIDDNPTWAAEYASGPIDRAPLSEFAEFVQAVVERYDGDGQNDAPGSPIVRHFEFYNEPDAAGASSFVHRWGDDGDKYAGMLCAVAPAMKAANINTKVLMGGIAYDYFQDENGPFVRKFLDDVLAAGGGQCLDYMVFHYYPAFEFRWTPYAPGITGKALFLRNKLQEYGVGNLPMIITEAGYNSTPGSPWFSSERRQASYVVKFFTQAIATDIKVLIWWTWTDLPAYSTADGLLTTNLQPKEAYFAFQTAVNKIGLSVYQRRIPASELGSADVEAYLFSAPKPLYVLWVNGDTMRQVVLPGDTAHVRDLFNNSLGLITDASDGQQDGSIHLTVGATPEYVEIIQ